MRPILRRALWFLAALALGGVAAALLRAAGLAESWSILIGWVVFFAAGAALAVDSQQRRGR